MIQIATPSDKIVQAKWQESYGTDIDDCKVWAKISPGANAPTPIIVYDTPPGGGEDNEDDEHKTVVTDITLEKGYAAHLMYAGGATPDGWSLESGAGEYFEDVFPVGAKTGLEANSDTTSATASLVSCGGATPCTQDTISQSGYAKCGHTHPELGNVATQGNAVPEYIELKVIRSNKIKASIPKDAIIIFDDTLPTGFTRYATADGYYIRGGGTVGATGGSATRVVNVYAILDYNSAISYGKPNASMSGEYDWVNGPHQHAFDEDSDAINNTPPYINVILGKADEMISYIPEGAILMFDEVPPNADWEVLEWDGKLLKGAETYGGTGGSATSEVNNISGTSSAPGNDTPSYWWWCIAGSTYASQTHGHVVEYEVDDVSNYPKCRPVIFAKAKHNITEDGESACIIDAGITLNSAYTEYGLYSACGRHVTVRNKGNDQGELHCCFAKSGGSGDDYVYHGVSGDGGKTWDITRVDAENCNQLYSDIVVDKNNNIHMIWARSDSGDTSKRQIMYRKLSSDDVWGSVETVSTAGTPYYQRDPCIQVKNDGETIAAIWVGQGWGTDSDWYDIAYRERTTDAWGAEEHITSDAISTSYYRGVTLDFDSDDYPNIAANKGPQSTTDNLYYWYKTGEGWQAAELVNNDAGDTNEVTAGSNILLDKDDNIHIAYVKSNGSDPSDICYKKKTHGGAWGEKETVALHTASKHHAVPQIQIGTYGTVYCMYTVQNLTDYRYELRSRVKTDSWGAEQTIRAVTGRDFMYGQLLWSRLPKKDGIYQSMSQQEIVAIYYSGPSYDHTIGNFEMITSATTVVGDPDGGDPTTETYRTKRRGALCKTKFQNKVAPAKIS